MLRDLYAEAGEASELTSGGGALKAENCDKLSS
jgi:hypothetical protein